MGYNTYKDIRGNAAKKISVAMEINEPSGIAFTGYLIEIREATDHVRLSAHGVKKSREVLIYDNRKLEIIDLEKDDKKARKTVFSPEGTITIYDAPWNAQEGFTDTFAQVDQTSGRAEQAAAEWEKYDALLMSSELLASRQPNAPTTKPRKMPPPMPGKII